MSRRAAPENTAERNRNTLKQLVKLEANKSCCDCKRNKRMLKADSCGNMCGANAWHRSSMGKLELGYLHLHKVGKSPKGVIKHQGSSLT
jgi:hypothetical protein